ncbi:MAG: hypothetical protein HYY06_08515 [Deltaproteobacteria bacterium]|nr:hypothetical protein [Deltaproteobacteria bacterium]
MRSLWTIVVVVLLASSCVAVSRGDGERCGRRRCAANECCLVSCSGADSRDRCAVPPDACVQIYAPVCGCDGVTYSNDCEAHANCVAVNHLGQCGDPCAGVDLPPCPPACPDEIFVRCGQRCETEGETCGNDIGDARTCLDGTWQCVVHPPLGTGCNLVCRD